MLARYTTETGSYYDPLLHVWRTGDISRFPLYDPVGSARMLVDASGTVTDTYHLDTWGRRYSVDFVDIKELRVSNSARSHYLLSTPRLVVVTRSGEEYDLPLRLRDRAALVDRIVGSAGLDRQSREARWDVYSRPA